MKRLVSAFFNSVAGLRHGFANEAAIRQELIAIAVSIPVVPILTLDPWKMLLLWGSLFFVLIRIKSNGISGQICKCFRSL